ncbi:S8 family serine peptidase [Paraburkholderia caribensis]|uniref:S8 family serine peptidase n=1 Tax=Paraburkholderia caribensis TaxID=75105 RepID=UPI0004BC8363|nr:S8 family serine peptidase [Paraburkholderia caribensis]
MDKATRFLIKMRKPDDRVSLTLSGTDATFKIEPLFGSIDKSPALAAADAPVWHIATPTNGVLEGNPWDHCHEIVKQSFGLAGGGPVFAEPDFAQRWQSVTADQERSAAISSCEAVAQKTDGYPGIADNNFWYQDDEHTQFAAALANAGVSADRWFVRVAHLDTGYDPQHASLPSGLEKELQKNFVDETRPNDASDDTAGPFNNLGHGTGTLSILAGKPSLDMQRLGAVPFLKVVPIRVANRVELFFNSSIAKAFDYVHSLTANDATRVHVVSMSMGGLASQAWADAVNALYESGVVVVTAAGNNFSNLPTRNIVFPARFNRVIAACGVMSNFEPYADLKPTQMAGNYGPKQKMRTAMAAYTPNVPWAKFGCRAVVDFDGSGTSAATPQIAAAAALWIQKNKAALDECSEPWMRAELVRAALFKGASKNPPLEKYFGQGMLRVQTALATMPAVQDIKKEEPDSASFSFLKVLTGLGIEAEDKNRQRMLELEALQLSQSGMIEAVLPDASADPESLTLAQRMALRNALASHPAASDALRKALQAPPAARPPQPVDLSSMGKLHLSHALHPKTPDPLTRRLRIFAYDPSLGRSLDTLSINETVAQVRWESELGPGPTGEYIEVVDVDPASACCYAPVDLNHPNLLASDGLAPSEANPQFHQQMAYAISMKTIEHFEKALGRVSLWAPREVEVRGADNAGNPSVRKHLRYVPRLRIYPHALRKDNAYYSPEKKALLLGYFVARPGSSGAPSEPIFTALSHDIVAHETTHALLDGLHRRFREPTNPDVLAFHEAFADIVALFQHFTLRDSLRSQIVKSRGDLTQQTLLPTIAVQFGAATGHYSALRDAIGKMIEDKDGVRTYQLVKPDVKDYQRTRSGVDPHEHGATLVSAVFDAFMRIYSRRALTPIRLATNGSEVLPAGSLSVDLADALTDVATKVASHVLNICIRALDYCPPVDITFGDYLRAVITADRDLVPDDQFGYRVAFVSAFSARGIYPENVRNFSVDTMIWESPPEPFSKLKSLIGKLSLAWDMQSARHRAWVSSRENASKMHEWLMDPAMVSDDELTVLGLKRAPDDDYSLTDANGNTHVCDLRGIEVHSVRPLRRVGPDGQLLSQLIIELTQSLHATEDTGLVFRGGASLVIDLVTRSVSYMIRKRFDQPSRVTQQQALWQQLVQDRSDNYNGVGGAVSEPFALLHGLHGGRV